MTRLRAPLDHPSMAALPRALDDVFWLSDRAPGFVWRLKPDDGPLVFASFGGADDVVVTLSVWMDFAALQRFVYRTAHSLFMQQRARWFAPFGGFSTAMWWIPAGTVPTVDEGLARLARLRGRGPNADTFSLGRPYDPPA